MRQRSLLSISDRSTAQISLFMVWKGFKQKERKKRLSASTLVPSYQRHLSLTPGSSVKDRSPCLSLLLFAGDRERDKDRSIGFYASVYLYIGVEVVCLSLVYLHASIYVAPSL